MKYVPALILTYGLHDIVEKRIYDTNERFKAGHRVNGSHFLSNFDG